MATESSSNHIRIKYGAARGGPPHCQEKTTEIAFFSPAILQCALASMGSRCGSVFRIQSKVFPIAE